ncbi:MAG: DUF1349 domain-containing protein [Anaerolineae bacterium]|nr:DUF1349 domain-containing protein [Anaerolineae bacterium]
MTTFSLSTIPAELQWKNTPVDWQADEDGSLSLSAGAKTDWFTSPAGNVAAIINAPAALFALPEGDFTLSARVTVEFASDFDAGVLCFYERDDLWAKLCFEFSPQREPMVVSVVTRGLSDDCNSRVIDGNSVYLRIARIGTALAMHYSLDGGTWHFVRHFTLENAHQLHAGFLAQSPTGQGCEVTFSDIVYRAGTLKDLRSGD